MGEKRKLRLMDVVLVLRKGIKLKEESISE
jgi:hypothetical protein